MENSLAMFTASFGRTLNDCPDILPAFNNYYQDIGPGGSRLGNLTKVDGQLLFPANSDPNKEYAGLAFEWYINGVLVSTKQNPTLADLKPAESAGVVRLRLKVEHMATQSFAEREEWAWLQYNDLPIVIPPDSPGILGVFYPFFPDVPPHHFMKLYWDYNTDGKVSSTDLTIFLAEHSFL